MPNSGTSGLPGLVLVLGIAALFPSGCERSRSAETSQLPTGFERLGRGVDDVTLRGPGGTALRWGDQAGLPRALFFGFTNCPDICPTTVQELAAAKERLGSRAAGLKFDFVTIDPERDTPEALALYFSGFGVDVRAYAGDLESTKRIADAFRVAYKSVRTSTSAIRWITRPAST
jgi:protein SCO1/2